MKLATKEIFVERLVTVEQHSGIPSKEHRAELREFLLLRIIADKDDREVIGSMNKWFEHELELTASRA